MREPDGDGLSAAERVRCGRLRLAAAGLIKAAGLGVLAAVTACGSAGPPAVSLSTPAAQPDQGPLPAVSGTDVHALWDGAQSSDLTVSNGMVFGDFGSDGVEAVRAATGMPVWAATLPGSLPDVLGLVSTGKVVVIEAGHDFGQLPFAVIPAVTDYIALDQATGRQLWTLAADGSVQQPPIAVSGNLVLITDNQTSTVTARNAATGTIAWRAPRPAGCPALPHSSPGSLGLDLAADGPLIAVSFECDSGAAIVVRLAPETGKPLWTWQPPANSQIRGDTSLITVARDGSAVLVATPTAPASTRSYRLAAAFSASNQEAVALVLDAATGHPRWSIPNSPEESFVMTDGDVCEIYQGEHTGAECRDDTSGAATMPALVTAPGAAPRGTAIVPFIGNGLVVTMAPASGGGFTVRVNRVRGGATEAQAHLAISVVADQEPSYQTSAVTSGPLPAGRALILLQLPGHPVTLAITVPAPRA